MKIYKKYIREFLKIERVNMWLNKYHQLIKMLSNDYDEIEAREIFLIILNLSLI